MEKAKEIGPPTSVAPVNIAPLFSSGALRRDVEFSWRPMRNAVGYRLRISRNPYFSSKLVEKKGNAAAVTGTNLGKGVYYWVVQTPRGKSQCRERKQRLPYDYHCHGHRAPSDLIWNSISSFSTQT